MDALLKQRLIHALTEYDRRTSASEAKRGHRVNVYRFAILIQSIDAIEERYDGNGGDLRAAILRHSCGRFASALLKGAGLPTLTKEEARA